MAHWPVYETRHELLDVSRITSGGLELDNKPIDVCKIARQVADNFRPIAEHSQCNLTTDLPAQDLIVSGDRLAIEEIIDNLVSNAIKYGRGQPIVVSARADPSSDCAVLQVRDGGPGISDADKARIFERFERAVLQEERRGGFGIGLWIARQLTEAMGGKIEVLSEAGAGSSFCVSIPLQPSGESP